MSDLVERSVLLTTQIRAVDVGPAVTLVLNAHFLPDVMGNLKGYATQKFRCRSCGDVLPSPAPDRSMHRRAAGGRVQRRTALHRLRGVRPEVPPARRSAWARWTGSPRTSVSGSGSSPIRWRSCSPRRPPRRRSMRSGRPSARRRPGPRRARDGPLPRNGQIDLPLSSDPRACGVVWTILSAFEANDLGSKSWDDP